MNKYTYFLKNIGIFTLSSISTKLITFFLLPFYTYYLSTGEFGTTDLLNTTLQMILPAVTLSMAEAVLRFAIVRESDKTKVFSMGFQIILCSIGLVLLLLPLLQLPIFGDLAEYKLWFLLIYSVVAFNGLFANFARTLDHMKHIAVNSILTTAVTCALNILLIAKLHMGVTGFMCALFCGNLLSFLSYFFLGKYYRYLRFGFDSQLLKRMLLYCVPLIPNALFWWANSSINRYFLTAMTSLAAVGLFSAAGKISALLNTVISIFQQAWNVSAFQEFGTEKSEKFFNNIYQVYSLVAVFISSTIILGSEILSHFLLQKDFFSGWVLIPWLVFSFFFNALNAFFGTIYTASQKTKYLFTTTLAGTVVAVVLNFVLIAWLGMMGAAIATCASNFLVWLMRLRSSQRILKIHLDGRKMLLSQLLLLSMVLVMSNRLPYYFPISAGLWAVLLLLHVKSWGQAAKTVLQTLRARR